MAVVIFIGEQTSRGDEGSLLLLRLLLCASPDSFPFLYHPALVSLRAHPTPENAQAPHRRAHIPLEDVNMCWGVCKNPRKNMAPHSDPSSLLLGRKSIVRSLCRGQNSHKVLR